MSEQIKAAAVQTSGYRPAYEVALHAWALTQLIPDERATVRGSIMVQFDYDPGHREFASYMPGKSDRWNFTLVYPAEIDKADRKVTTSGSMSTAAHHKLMDALREFV